MFSLLYSYTFKQYVCLICQFTCPFPRQRIIFKQTFFRVPLPHFAHTSPEEKVSVHWRTPSIKLHTSMEKKQTQKTIFTSSFTWPPAWRRNFQHSSWFSGCGQHLKDFHHPPASLHPLCQHQLCEVGSSPPAVVELSESIQWSQYLKGRATAQALEKQPPPWPQVPTVFPSLAFPWPLANKELSLTKHMLWSGFCISFRTHLNHRVKG